MRAFVWLALVVACGPAPEPAASPPRPPPVPAGVRAAAVIDSHVHLQYAKHAEQLAQNGVVAAVDLGAPLGTVGGEGPVQVLHAGPMLTRHDGYPINAWDPGGFGVGCDVPTCAEAVVARIALAGGRVIKVVAGDDGLPPEMLATVVRAAHARGMKVAVHALTDEAALDAAITGCDVLAHTPVEPLAVSTVAAWAKPSAGRGRAVVSTLAAFGGRPETIENLRKLRAAGVTVLYGTDLGNTQVTGVDPEELRLLAAAGLDAPAIVAAMTTAPAAFWGITLPAGTHVMLDRDPAQDPTAYTHPLAVWIGDQPVR